MSATQAIYLGGAFNTALFVFHAFFWRIFRWRDDLASLTSLNRAVMQVLNLCLMFAFAIFAYVSFFHADELLGTPLGRAMLVLIAAFWLLRALQQPVFFRVRGTVNAAFFSLFLVGAALYAWPAWVALA